MRFKFYTTFRFLKLVGDNFDDFDLLPRVTIIRDRAKIRKVLSKDLKEYAGIIEFDHLYNANHLVHVDLKDDFFPPQITSNNALFTWILWIDMLVNTSWLIKDNGILCEIAYCNKTDRKNYSEWSNNSLMSMFTFSDGERHKEVGFTREELVNWKKKNHKVQTYLFNNSSTVFDSFLDSKYSRYGRALNVIKAAKREYNPAMKIAHYCSALESLFSTDSAELSYKLSERVAFFLKPYGYDPIKTFDEIKAFYNIRSKVTHGDSLKTSKVDSIPEESKKLDCYLRVIMNTILESENLMTIFNGKKEDFESYFKSKILLG